MKVGDCRDTLLAARDAVSPQLNLILMQKQLPYWLTILDLMIFFLAVATLVGGTLLLLEGRLHSQRSMTNRDPNSAKGLEPVSLSHRRPRRRDQIQVGGFRANEL